MSSSIIPRIILFLILRSRTIHDAFVLARIVPNDDDLSVFPDSCPNSGRWTPSSSVNANCGIHRLDGSHRSWTLRSGDGVYKEKSAIVSHLNTSISIAPGPICSKVTSTSRNPHICCCTHSFLQHLLISLGSW